LGPSVFPDVRAQNVLGRNTPLPGEPQVPFPGKVSDCFVSEDRQPLALYFLLVDAAGNMQGTPGLFKDFGFDVIPPSPPGRFTASPGRGRLEAEWTPSTSTDVTEYRILCDAPSSHTFDHAPGCAAPDALTTLCGVATGTDTSGFANGLDGDRLTSTAVVAVDSVENLSAPSPVACSRAVPPAPDSLESRGCACTLPRSPKSVDRRVAGILALCAALVFRRCRRRH
jgi:hypothetical protein